jgi:hypothetical protein
MKNKHSHLLVTFAICIFTCFAFPSFSSAQNWFQNWIKINKLFNVKLRNKQVYEVIHFKLKDNMVVIPVTINGKTYSFIFDTGASTAFFSDSLAKNFKPKHSISVPTTDADGIEQAVDFYLTDDTDNFQIGSLYFDNVGYGVSNLDVFEDVLCTHIDGILGDNILSLLNWEIDFSNKTIVVSQKPFSVDNYSMEIPFKESFGNRTPEVKMQMGKYVFYAALDMGYNGGIKISDSIFFKSGKSSYLEYSKGEGRNDVTLFNERITKNKYKVVIDSFYIGNNLIVNEEVDIEPYPSRKLVGNSFLEQYEKVTINWKQKKIFLEGKNESDTVGTGETMGFSFDLQDDKLIVISIWEDSKAYKEGIRMGDQIISVNDISTENIDRSKWCEISEEIDNSDKYTMELLNAAGETATITVRVKK